MERLDLIPQTARYRELDKLEQYYESRQYEGRPDWWTGLMPNGDTAPLRERRPCITYPLPKATVQQLVRFMIGTEAWPTLKVEDDRVPDEVREDVAKTISDIIAACKLKPAMRAVMARALAARTAVAVFGLRGGRLQIDTPKAKDCVPQFEDDDPCRPVTSLSWVYQYEAEVEDTKLGRLECKRFWFRRDIDAESVTEYEPAPVEVSSAKAPEWRIKSETPHGFGFCPVLWLRNMPEVSDGSIDGVSIYEDQFESFDALNFALSQRNRGIYFYGTPQPVETGVADDDGPEAEGRKARQRSQGPKGYSGTDPAPFGAAEVPARRMAPDYIWSYRNERATVSLIETTGKWFEVTTKHVEDIRARILESVGVVLVNANAILSGAGRDLSGRFLELSYAPMLAHVDELRDACWWDHIHSMISMAMRILASVNLTEATVHIPRIAEVQQVVRMFVTDGTWMPPILTPLWGPSFSLTAEETKVQTEAADSAHKAGLISRETAARYVAPAFGVQDVDGELEEVDEEAAEAAVAAPAMPETDQPSDAVQSTEPDMPAMMGEGKAPMSDAESGVTESED